MCLFRRLAPAGQVQQFSGLGRDPEFRPQKTRLEIPDIS